MLTPCTVENRHINSVGPSYLWSQPTADQVVLQYVCRKQATISGPTQCKPVLFRGHLYHVEHKWWERHSRLVPDLRGRALSPSPPSEMSAVGCSCKPLTTS